MSLKHSARCIALLSSSLAATFAQTTAAPPPLSSSASFDVVSIKLPDPNSRGGGLGFGPTGFTASSGFPLLLTIATAYFPPFTGSKVLGYPAWVGEERYDITAKIDEADAPAWSKLSVGEKLESGRPMLQKVLAQRFNLRAHLVPAQIDGYALVVSKGGSHLTPTKQGETYPDGALNGGDGAKVIPPSPANNNTMSYFNATVQQLAERIGFNWTVEDKTGISGRYDFTIRRLEQQKDPDGKPILSNPEPYDVWDISSTGLELKHAKVITQNLVVDHIERPTEN